jgi:hypothetical protein
MSPERQWFGILYIAWALLLLVTAVVQQSRAARRACLLAVAGFVVLGANLFTPPGAVHWVGTVVALAILVKAAALTFKVKNRPE